MKKKQMGKKRKKESKLSIKYKLFAYFGGFTLLILIFLWVFQTVFLDDFYKYIKTKEIIKFNPHISVLGLIQLEITVLGDMINKSAVIQNFYHHIRNW